LSLVPILTVDAQSTVPAIAGGHLPAKFNRICGDVRVEKSSSQKWTKRTDATSKKRALSFAATDPCIRGIVACARLERGAAVLSSERQY